MKEGMITMSEITKYEEQKKKMQGLCEEHDLVFRFRKTTYPITFTVTPVQGMDAQLSMLENVEDVGYRSPEASVTWIFEDGSLTMQIKGGTFTISKTLRSKIENILIKMISFWQQFFFRDIIEHELIRKGSIPVIDEDEADDSWEEEDAPEDEELQDIEDDEDSEVSIDDPLIQQAISIVRVENKATTALLQRRLYVSFAKAYHIMKALEQLGVIGPDNGSGQREVLPIDVPDDEDR